MKTIGVLRHAKSRWDDANLSDFDRPLNERGWAAARKIGLELKRLELQVDLVLASSAVRVRETIKGIEEAFPFSATVRFEQALYLADERLLLDRLDKLAEDINGLLVVGHNPGLQDLILALSNGQRDARYERVRCKFPTGALAIIQSPAERWEQVQSARNSIRELLVPKDLD